MDLRQLFLSSAASLVLLWVASQASAQHGGHGGGGHAGGGHPGGGHPGGGHPGAIHGGHAGGYHPGYYHGGYYHGYGYRPYYGGGFYGPGFYGPGFYGPGLGLSIGLYRPYYGYGYGYGGYGYGAYAPYYGGVYAYPPPVVAYAPNGYGPNGVGPAPGSAPPTGTPPTNAAPQQAPDDAAHLQLNVPETAEVWFDGSKTTQTGKVREFTSPKLNAGQTYTYHISVRYTDASGQPVNDTRDIHVRANDWFSVDFTRPAPAAPPAPPK